MHLKTRIMCKSHNHIIAALNLPFFLECGVIFCTLLFIHSQFVVMLTECKHLSPVFLCTCSDRLLFLRNVVRDVPLSCDPRNDNCNLMTVLVRETSNLKCITASYYDGNRTLYSLSRSSVKFAFLTFVKPFNSHYEPYHFHLQIFQVAKEKKHNCCSMLRR